MLRRGLNFILLCSYLLIADFAHSQQLRVAVATNFAPTLKAIVPAFEEKYEVNVDVISAASGVLFQQATFGAPFDVFVSADSLRPAKLSQQGLAHYVNTYAYGKLVLFSNNPKVTSIEDLDKVKGKIAIANPKTAPYGIAAKEALQHSKVWQKIQPQLVTANNVAQAHSQFLTGNVEAALVSESFVVGSAQVHRVDIASYNRIVQSVCILSNTKDQAIAKAFVTYLLSSEVQNVIEKHGYDKAQGGKS
ncbi:molybdate ABC transporter substrate-binding protein [Thalassotalea agarivorans]|uniref:Molybdate transport system substrate-binding protein n=1 Tax=Thalassotalea agarivorans TaxID=349064 RepID=A0A1I0AR10_THASX|nr:molybdate ABC transporter substrate-binding protein [Thalassotalea agarivorans]SES96769.1 molybdate transport system substrate-binding protein [Thalassotalea agarivorans]